MANIIIKSDERRRDEQQVRNSFYAENTRENNEHAEAITAYIRESQKEGDLRKR